MKKLMASAIVAAMGLGAFADAQVYEMTLTLKTTVTKSGQVKFISCDCMDDSDSNLYRKQGTVKIKGLIWGCDCITIGEPDISSDGDSLAEQAYGYIFWNETTKKPMNLKFEWEFLNRIDKTLKKSEGTWTLTSDDDSFHVMGSGFGTVKDTVVDDERESTQIVSMKGNLAGWSTPGAIVTVKATSGSCSWCNKVAGTEEETAAASALSLCDCDEADERTAANGTWSLKYSTRAAKKLADSKNPVDKITQAYAFPAYVKSVIE